MKKLEDYIWYKENTVVHCKTEEEANEFCELMDSYGLRWGDDKSYKHFNNYNFYSENSCYNALSGGYGYYNCYKKFNYTILEWSEIKNMNKFTKKDLKTGMWVELRNGEKYMVVKDCETKNYGKQDFCLITTNRLVVGEYYSDDLTYKNECRNLKKDIIKILGSKYISTSIFIEPTNIIAEINQEANIMTIEEIECLLGIKNLKIVGGK